MGVEQCPNCERGYNNFPDYPRVIIRDFEKIPLLENTLFPECEEIYGANAMDSRLKAPAAVVEFFQGAGNRDAFFEHDGARWLTDGTLVMDVYGKFVGCARTKILAEVEPYLAKLEGLVGKEVSIVEALPPHFAEFRLSEGPVPNTTYELMIYDNRNIREAYGPPVSDADPLQVLVSVCHRELMPSSVRRRHFTVPLAYFTYKGLVENKNRSKK